MGQARVLGSQISRVKKVLLLAYDGAATVGSNRRLGHNTANDHVSAKSRSLYPSIERRSLLPPEVEPDRDNDEHNSDVEALDGADQAAPVLSEQVAGTGDTRHPGNCAQEIEDGERAPTHTQDAGKRTRKNSHPEDEAGKENGSSAMASKKFFPAIESLLPNAKQILVTLEQWTSTIVAEHVTEIISQSGRARGYDDDPSEMQFVLGVGEKTRQQ